MLDGDIMRVTPGAPLRCSTRGTKAVAAGLALMAVCLLHGTLCFAEGTEGDKADTPGVESKKPEKGKTEWTELLAAIGAAMGLIGTAVGGLMKTVESISLRARRTKELQHIEDLTLLMEKIKKENVLSKSTMDSVSAQIEAEITTALEELERNREGRRIASEREQKRGQALELGFPRRVFLLYRPHGARAFIAHGLAYASLAFGLYCVYLTGVPSDVAGADQGFHWREFSSNAATAVVFFLFFFFLMWLFGRWALWERTRWKRAAAGPTTAASG